MESAAGEGGGSGRDLSGLSRDEAAGGETFTSSWMEEPMTHRAWDLAVMRYGKGWGVFQLIPSCVPNDWKLLRWAKLKGEAQQLLIQEKQDIWIRKAMEEALAEVTGSEDLMFIERERLLKMFFCRGPRPRLCDRTKLFGPD